MANIKIDVLQAALDTKIEQFLACTNELIALIATPLDPPEPSVSAAALARLDGLHEPFRRATRNLEIELRRSGTFIATPQTGPMVNVTQHIARRTLRAWTPMREVLERALLGAEDPVLPTWQTGMAQTQIEALSFSFIMLDQILNNTDQHESAAALGAHRDIPLMPHQFFALIHAARRLMAVKGIDRPLRFLDVGSGRGTTLLMAGRFFHSAHGIEFDPGYHEHAQRLLSSGRTEHFMSIQANALEFENYGDYDVIYFYKPMQDYENTVKLEQRIVSQARPGTLLIAPYLGFVDRYSPDLVENVAWDISQMNGSGHSAQALNAAIRWIGPFVQHPDTTISKKVCGHWGPLVQRLAARGFQPSSLE